MTRSRPLVGEIRAFILVIGGFRLACDFGYLQGSPRLLGSARCRMVPGPEFSPGVSAGLQRFLNQRASVSEGSFLEEPNARAPSLTRIPLACVASRYHPSSVAGRPTAACVVIYISEMGKRH